MEPLDSLFAFARSRGHPEHPVLSARYSPMSGVPCTDFSPWLHQRLRANDEDALCEYVWRVREANPGVGLDEKAWRREYSRATTALIRASVDRHIAAPTTQAISDLRIALLVVLPLEGLSGFILTGGVPRYLATVMVVYPLRFCAMDPVVTRARAFVDEMAKDVPYWRNGWTLPEAEELEAIAPPAGADVDELRAAMAQLPIGSRAHMGDLLPGLVAIDAPIARRLEESTSYVTRQRGCDPVESASRLFSSGLFEETNDLCSILRGWTQKELVGLGLACGLPIKKSWPKTKLVPVLASQASAAVTDKTRGHRYGILNDRLVPAARRLLAHIDAMTIGWGLLAGFGVLPETGD